MHFNLLLFSVFLLRLLLNQLKNSMNVIVLPKNLNDNLILKKSLVSTYCLSFKKIQTT